MSDLNPIAHHHSRIEFNVFECPNCLQKIKIATLVRGGSTRHSYEFQDHLANQFHTAETLYLRDTCTVFKKTTDEDTAHTARVHTNIVCKLFNCPNCNQNINVASFVYAESSIKEKILTFFTRNLKLDEHNCIDVCGVRHQILYYLDFDNSFNVHRFSAVEVPNERVDIYDETLHKKGELG